MARVYLSSFISLRRVTRNVCVVWINSTSLIAVPETMAYLVMLMAILCCEQAVMNNVFDTSFVKKTFQEAQQQCDTKRLVLPRKIQSNMMWAKRIQSMLINATWIDLIISPSPWNWITDVGYTIYYDQGCYSLSSQHDQWMITLNNTNVSTCMEFCEGHLYVGVQLISNDHLNCVCTNKTEIASTVSENECGADCNITGIKQACGKTSNESSTYRLLSTQESSPIEGRIPWRDNPDLNITSSFLCASMSIRNLTAFQHPYISVIPQTCAAELPAICKSENGTINITEPMPWFEAQKQCREYGMKMAGLSSAYQPNILELPVEQEGWVALRGWVWSSQGHEIRDLFYTNWSAGYPNKSEGDCIIILKDGSWRNVPCDADNSFFCELPSTSSKTSPPGSNSPHITPSVTMPTMTDVIHNTSSPVDVTPGSGSGVQIMVAAAVGTSIGILVLVAVAVIVIICLRKKKPALLHGNHARRNKKGLRPECDLSMDELPICASPNKDPPTDGVILVVENSLYGSVDPDDEVLPALLTSDDITAMLETNGENIQGGLAMPEQMPRLPKSQLSNDDPDSEDDILVVDNSLYDSTNTGVDALPVHKCASYDNN